jgi:hypothetical protein
MTDPHTIAERSGRTFTVIFLVCVGLLGFALYLQHVKDLDPCPWCVVQRLGFILVGLIALVGALHRPGLAGTVGYSILGLAASLAGAAAGAYHVWPQATGARGEVRRLAGRTAARPASDRADHPAAAAVRRAVHAEALEPPRPVDSRVVAGVVRALEPRLPSDSDPRAALTQHFCKEL